MDMEETWQQDPNQFIADEDEETFSFNTRIAFEDLVVVR